MKFWLKLLFCSVFIGGGMVLYAQQEGPAGASYQQRALAFIKGPGKRTLHMPGSYLHIQLNDKRNVKGYIYAIGDTSVNIGGVECNYKNIQAYYVPRSAFRIVGGALGIGGAGYMVLGGVNTLINSSEFDTKTILIPGFSLLGAGAVLFPFKEVKHRTSVWKIKVMDI